MGPIKRRKTDGNPEHKMSRTLRQSRTQRERQRAGNSERKAGHVRGYRRN